MNKTTWRLIVISACGLSITSGHEIRGEATRDLDSNIAAVRRQAAVLLGQKGDRAAVPSLALALRDPRAEVRREAARSLGLLKDPRAVPALIAAIRDEDPNVRMYAAYALGEIKDPQASDALRLAFRDAAWCVRDQAAWALREIKDPKSVTPLVARLSESDADVEAVFWILLAVERTAVIEQLTALLKSPHVLARERAVLGLRRLGEPKTCTPLLAALGDPEPTVRVAAVGTLAELSDERTEPAFRELLRTERDARVREAVEEALRRLSRGVALAAYWSFDDGRLDLAKDMTERGTDGTVNNCRAAEGKVGRALAFTQDSYVELGRPAALPIAGLPFTVTAWIKAEAGNGVVVARGGAFCGYSLYVKDGAAKFGIHLQQSGPTYIAAGSEQVVGKWVHLVGVVKEDRIQLYVNGVLAASAETSGYFPGNCGQGMQIGWDQGNSPAEITDHFVGLIDEVKIYQAALTGEEIARHFRAAP